MNRRLLNHSMPGTMVDEFANEEADGSRSLASRSLGSRSLGSRSMGSRSMSSRSRPLQPSSRSFGSNAMPRNMVYDYANRQADRSRSYPAYAMREHMVDDSANLETDYSRPLPVYAMPGGDRPQRELVAPARPRSAGGWRNGEKKVTVGGSSVRVATIDRELFAELFLGVQCIRSEEKTTVELTLDQADVEVGNCCTGKCTVREGPCDRSCKTAFIYKLTVEVTPESWGGYCSRLTVQPPHTAEVYEIQRINNLSIWTPVLNPAKTSIVHQIGKAVSHTDRAFGWKPARKDPATHSAIFAWEVSRHADGSKLKFGHTLGTRPGLAIPPGSMQILSESLLKASWELGPNAKLQQHRLAWNVKVTLHTAVLQSNISCYSVEKGPVLSYKELLII